MPTRTSLPSGSSRPRRSGSRRSATTLKRKQAERGGRGGALTIAVRPDACRTGALPAGPVRATTYLRTGETGGYVPLARDVDLRTVMAGRDVVAEIPAC